MQGVIHNIKENLNAMKETRPMENDRNMASPTESAVRGKQGLGTLRSRLPEPYSYARVIRYTR